MDIQWKEIEGYPGYLIGNHGYVRTLPKTAKGTSGSLRRVKERVLKDALSTAGYRFVVLYSNEVPKMHRLGRLVAKHFIGNPNGFNVVNHIDGDKKNDHVLNLEWCTQSHNVTHAHDIGLHKSRRPVIQMDIHGNILREFKSLNETEKYGFSHGNIGQCCIGNRHTHKGFKWKFK